ncbi:serine/threonine protein kinase [Streptomyces yaizuensis]|uniref:non-specific serine/threonine protein kinase n=1 Tax=Streptomyces yaizuensis TaxID=2989713 RepID=A0ABQ5P4W9_9ACTN|nr:protein kinase [Streptomyces sp. YSPA8]GLF97638.1 serine/threonine protein kinase [Streptomyces sp. YSPA8]
MSEAEQSREPQQDKSTSPGTERTGGAAGGSQGVTGTGARTGRADDDGHRDRTGTGGADTGTDAVERAEVEPEGTADAADQTRPADSDATSAAARSTGRAESGATAAVPRQSGAVEPARATGGGRESGGAAGAAKTARSGRPAAGADTGRRRTGARSDSGSDVEGRLLAGRYRLGGVLGRGGMGTVWRAEDETLGRTVAVKELRFPNSVDEEEKRRLITRTLREAKAIARIRDNSAVTVFDVVDEDNRPWIVMELIEGKSLAEVIREDGTLTPRRAAEVGLAILDVLRSAHREGILHRDVKPSNVLISDDGRVVLTDFGIAQVEGDPSITSTGMLVGAPSYISPERARGHRPGPAADLWSLGGLLYASVEGCPPYDKGSAIATLTAVMTEPLDPPRNAGPLLEEVIYGLLAKDPEQRLGDAGARALLTKAVHAPETPARAEPAPEATRAMVLPPMPPPPARKTGPARPAPARRSEPPRPVAQGPVRPAAPGLRQPAPVPAPADRRPGPERAPLTDVVSRRTLVSIAVLVAAVVALAVVLYVTVGPGADDDQSTSGKKETTTSAGTGASGGSDATPDGETGRTADVGQGEGTTPDTGDAAGKETGGDDGAKDETKEEEADKDDQGDSSDGKVPEGYQQVSNDQFRFDVAMPDGFKMIDVAGQGSGGIYSESGGFPRVQIDFTATPGDDAAAAWNAAVPGTRSASKGYRHIGVRSVEFNGYPTVADWEFERDQQGQRIRVLNRGFKVDGGRGYAIMVSCPAADWNKPQCTELRETAFATFKPKG